MNRLAILLAAAGLGSGCVVSNSSSTPACNVGGALDVTWSFVDVNGTTGLACNGGVLSYPITSVDIWVDGVRDVNGAACSAYGATIAGVPAGNHSVIVAGYDVSGYIIARDSFSVSVCGNTSVLAQPGEGVLHIQPTNCVTSGNALTFKITDVTVSPSYVIWSQLPGTALTFTCGGGITEYVPYGNYDLTGIEETNGSASTIYSTLCPVHPLATDVTTWGTTSYNVAFDNAVAACF